MVEVGFVLTKLLEERRELELVEGTCIVGYGLRKGELCFPVIPFAVDWKKSWTGEARAQHARRQILNLVALEPGN